MRGSVYTEMLEELKALNENFSVLRDAFTSGAVVVQIDKQSLKDAMKDEDVEDADTRTVANPDDPLVVYGSEAPWIETALEYVGLDEEDDRVGIMADLLQPAGITIDPSETPWCAAFVDAILHKCGIEGYPGSLRARDYAEFGYSVPDGTVGSIVVYKSHVGFVCEPGKCLGGNQSDGITIGNIGWYGSPIAYRCPEGYQLI